MARNYQSGNAHLSHPRTTAHTIIAIGLVIGLAVASGFAYNLHENNLQRASQVRQSIKSSNDQSPITSGSAEKDNQEQVETMDQSNGNQSIPGSTSTSNSSTTVTVNGETTTVNGNGSVDKSYTSEDGKSKVHISVKNSVNNAKKELRAEP